MEKEYGTRTRTVKVLRALVERPYGYTRRQLAERYNVSSDTIKGDFDAITTAGFVLDRDKNHRYGLAEDKPYQELRSLLHFSEEDQLLLMQAIDQISPHSKRGERLKRKLSSLYDFGRLGHAYLRKPYLKKVDLLEKARKEKRQVILKGYHSSNSNKVSDRLVEPFHTSPPEDSLHAFDLEKQVLRHFRLSRITRVQLTPTAWQNEQRHIVHPTDPFRIVDPNQITVHLRLKVGAYNELIERFPLTRSYIEAAEEPDIYDFQCKVNHRFLGLTNFILGFYHQVVEIIEPESLLDHLKKEVKNMNF